jgi:multisubunit Na+/H+ antiporter MnhG subunit
MLIVVFIVVTTPISLTLLVRAALLRDLFETNEQASAQNRESSSTRS